MKYKASLYVPLLFAVVLILAGFSAPLAELMGKLSEEPFLVSTVIRLVVFLLPLAFYYQVRGWNLATGVKFSLVHPKKYPFLLVCGAILFMGVILFRYAGIFLFETAWVQTPVSLDLPIPMESGFLTVLAGAILPAVLDEILFRGILMEEYRSYGTFWSVSVSAVMFAMIHLSAENFLYYLFVGFVLGMVASVSDSVIPGMVLHFLLNLSGILFHDSVVNYLRQAGKSPLLAYLLIAVFIFLFYRLFAYLEHIYRDRAYDAMLQSRKETLRRELEEAQEKREDEKEPKKKFFELFKEIYLSPTLLVSYAVFVTLVSGIL